ncbi:hypothetical protein LUZ60_011297 [Juncus effusus]|nr:hypothetical protein LUZ60_011297 [Juncus effusus]
MGCGQSKIEQVETVARCKDRKRFMREVVMGRSALATAHSAYAISLKNIGAALSDYAQGECVISETHRPVKQNMSKINMDQPADKILPPPVPDSQTVSPLLRSSSVPLVAVPKDKGKAPMDASMREEEEDGDEVEEMPALIHSRRTRRPVQPPVPTPPMHEFNGIESTEEYWFPGSVPPPTLGTGNESYEYKPENELPPPPSPSPPPPPPPPPPLKYLRKWEGRKAKMLAMPPPPPSVSLLQLLNQLDDYFLRASDSAHVVSKNLEVVRMHYHSNFADNKGYIDHSARVMRVITWNQSISDGEESNEDLEKDEKWETLATILDKIFTWERKLYDEIKEAEIMKMAYFEKLDVLNKKKKRGAGPGSLEQAKTVASHLHTKYVVATQTVESTLNEIDRLRDSQLYPKLDNLVEEMEKMWEVMYQQHHKQLETIMELKSYEITSTSEETTDQHHDRTVQLFEMTREWHKQFHRLTSHQKEFVGALTSWLTLNLVKIDTSLEEKDESEAPRQRDEALPIERLLKAWNDWFEKLQDEMTLSAISTFSEVIRTIIMLQEEELKLKISCDNIKKELEKKRRKFEDWQHKYLKKRYSLPESSTGPSDPLQDPLMEERRGAVEALEKRWREEKESHEKQCKQVREKTIVSLRSSLPVLFRTLMEFSLASFAMYKELFAVTREEEQGEQGGGTDA